MSLVSSRKKAFPLMSAFSTAVAGLEGFVGAAATEVCQLNVRVNAVRVSKVHTYPFFSEAAEDSSDNHDVCTDSLSLEASEEVREISEAVCYLASGDSMRVTGQILSVDSAERVRELSADKAAMEKLYGKNVFTEFMSGR
jgi:enoyl-[acyl-carrier-protein] reductase (NADH)